MTIALRYTRNSEALSEEECASLADKTVAIVGCGGLGGYNIEMLSRIGVGHIRAIDGDTFEPSNLNRQILATEETLGKSKAQAAALRIAQVNPEVELEAHGVFLTEDNARELLAGSDCVVDALDNINSRFDLARACQSLGIPLVYGAISGWYGQVSTVYPGDSSFVILYGDPEGQGIQRRMGNLPFAAAATAAFQTAEVIKVLLNRGGLLRDRILMIDLLDGSCEDMEIH